MLHPLFTYPIRNTSWYIVVAKGASHFYYDTNTKTSVWQLSDTNVDDLSNKVNFDDLAVLFAKANGLKIGENYDYAKKRRLSTDRDGVKRHESKNDNYAADAAISDILGPQVEALSEEETLVPDTLNDSDVSDGIDDGLDLSLAPQVESSSHVEIGVGSSAGLNLGYSSSEESEDDDVEDGENNSASDLDVGLSENEDEDVNDGLDLGFGSEDENENTAAGEDAKTEFENLLDQYESEISIYDPWFLVEEELLPQFSQHPAFYGVADAAARESIFDSWVALKAAKSKGTEESLANKFPTPKMRFYQYLQDFKTEVRKTYYPEFYKKHAAEIDALDIQSKSSLESLYRELRVTLNDHAEYERAAKKRGAEGNLKVVRVEDYLREKLKSLSIPKEPLYFTGFAGNNDFYGCWIKLCNDLSLPDLLVSDPTNFILGDEKRLASYLRVLGSHYSARGRWADGSDRTPLTAIRPTGKYADCDKAIDQTK